MTDITFQIENYINSQNQNIWNELKNNYTFQLIYDPSEYSWKGKAENGIATIITPTQELEFHSFSHELLHIYLDYCGISNLEDLLYGIMGEHSFEVLTENNLTGILYNFCSHKKMFPFYKKMGFSEYQFVQERISFSNYNIFEIKLLFAFKKSRKKAVNQFIGQSLSLMNVVVEEDKSKCEKYLKKLQKIKPNLFKIISDFDKKWNESTDLNLATTFLNFEYELNEWLIKNKITAGNTVYN
jgi:hypothetical protein